MSTIDLRLFMRVTALVRKFKRNVADYGWREALSKVLARLFGFIYEKRVYRIYRIDLRKSNLKRSETCDFSFRVLTEDDADSISQIEAMAEWLEGELAAKIANGSLCCVAEDGNRMAGFELIAFKEVPIPLINRTRALREKEAWSEHIAVHKDYRRRGLASQIRRRAFDELIERSVKKMYGGMLLSNEANLQLARKNGFQEFVDIHYKKSLGRESWTFKRTKK
ncbi:GNAT family N-acetyltransferase [Candidatus Hydrogenedentota bacterium]